MSRKKLRLIVWMLVGLMCIGGGTYLGGRWLLSRKAQALHNAGLAAAQSGDDAGAVDLLLQYIVRRPSDTEAMKAYIKSRQRVPMTTGQQFADTISVLKGLLQREPDQIDNQRYLMQLYMELGRKPEALEVADTILNKNKLHHSNDALTLAMKTQVLIELANYQEAFNAAGLWKDAAPDDLRAQMAYLSMRFQLQQPSNEIVTYAQNLLAKHPDDARWQVLYGFALAKSEDSADLASRNDIHKSAMVQLKAAAAHTDLTDDVAKILVAQFDSMGELPSALGVLQNCVDHGGTNEMRYALAERFWELRAWQKVVETLKNLGTSDGQVDPTIFALKAYSLAMLNRAPEAAECLKALANGTRPDDVAWSALLRKMIANAAVSDKEIADDFLAATKIQPRNPYLLYFLGDGEARLGEIDLAVNAFGRAIVVDTHWSLPGRRMVDGLLAKGLTQQAWDEACFLVQRNGQNPDYDSDIAFSEAWAAGIANGDARAADLDDSKIAQNVLKFVAGTQAAEPNQDPILSVIKVIAFIEQGETEQAAQAARDAIGKKTAPPEQVFRAIANLSRQYHLGVEKDCSDAWKNVGITSGFAFTEAIAKAATRPSSEGLTLFDGLAAQSKKANDMDWRLARAQYLDATNNPEAKSAWISLRDSYPNDLSVQEAAANAKTVSGDRDFMLPVIDHLRALTGDSGLTWRLVEATLLIEHPRGDGEKDYETGSVELAAIVSNYPMLTQPRLLLAEALSHMKRLDGAIDQLTTVTKLQPSLVSASLQLVSLWQSRGESANAEKELKRILPSLQTPLERQQAAVLLAHQGMTDEAVTLLRPSQDYADKLILAELYQHVQETDKAKAIAKDLLDEHPTLENVQFAVALYYSGGRSEAADEAADKALHRLDDVDLQPGLKELAWGKYYFNQKHDLVSAETRFVNATRQAPLNVKAWQELAICQMAQGRANDALATINQGSKLNPSDAGLAKLRTNMPLLMDAAADGTLPSAVAAVIDYPLDADAPLELIGIVVEQHKANRPDQLATRLNEFIGRRANYAPARIALIQCYMSMDQLPDAIDTANRAVADFPNDPDLARILVVAYGQAGRWSDLAKAAQHWGVVNPAAKEIADAAAASAMVKSGDYQGATALLQHYLPDADADPDNHSEIVQAQVQDDIGTGNTAHAKDLLLPLVKRSQSWRKVWMQTAESMPDNDKQVAVNWLEQMQDIIPKDAPLYERAELADSFDAIGRRTTPNDPDLIKKASDIFADLAKDLKVDAAVLIVAAGQAERCKREADALRLYQQALTLDPKMWVAQNDVAMLICDLGGNLKEAEQLARAAVIAQPGRADVCDTLAEVERKSGNLKAAIAEMNEVVHLQPKTLIWRIRLAHYLLDSDDVVKASNALSEIDAEFPNLSNQPKEIQQQLTELRKQIHGNGKGT